MIHSLLRQFLKIDAHRFFDIDLWAVGGAHFVLLFASFQVPYRLGWKQDLKSLMPFNRKMLWVQSGFTVLTIVAFGTLTLLLHDELLRGDRAALGLACFIAIYWTTRILVDAFYFSHADWPKGPAFVVGHTLLTLLFFFLAISYAGLVLWHSRWGTAR
jgi:alginate O-acetyltransferase complex protein AlgI